MKEKQKSRYQTARRVLMFWTLFVGIGAVVGAAGLLLDPSGKSMGMDVLLPYFQKLPFADVLFQNYRFSGIALLIVNGATNLTAFVLMLCKKRLGVTLGGIFGITLMLWIGIQFYLFPLNVLSTAYFVFGLCQAATGYAAWVFARQEAFRFCAADYPHVGEDPGHLVVYFSRMGYTKKLAYETANRSGAKLFEVQTTERTEGTAGFWWCGRFGMHRWGMKIKEMPENLESYRQVTIVTPVWVFSLCAPLREFCKRAHGKIRSVDYVIVHFMRNAKFLGVAQEADTLLGTNATDVKSISSHFGSFHVTDASRKIAP